MGRKGKNHRCLKKIIVCLNNQEIPIELNANERIKNEDDLNLIPSKTKERKRRIIKIKQVKRSKSTETNEQQKKESNLISIENSLESNSLANGNEIQNEDEDNVFDLYDDLNYYGELNFDNEENNDLFFDPDLYQFQI